MPVTLRPVDKTALAQLPEKQRELLLTLIELAGSVVEVKNVLDELGKANGTGSASVDTIPPEVLVRELTYRRCAMEFGTALQRACGEDEPVAP